MRNSIKKLLILTNISIVVIVYITTILLCGNVIDTKNIFAISNILILLLFIAVSCLVSIIITRYITYPLKKIEKSLLNLYLEESKRTVGEKISSVLKGIKQGVKDAEK